MGGTAPLRNARLTFAAVALAGLIVDVISKVAAVAYLTEPVRLLNGVLTLRLIRNSGAAFSLGKGLTLVFALLAVAVLAFVIIGVLPRVRHRGWAVALGLLTAGVSGNLADRFFRSPGFLRGHVVDFLQLPRWPVFNVADMCITSSALMIVFLAVIKNVSMDGSRVGESERGSDRQPRRGSSSVE